MSAENGGGGTGSGPTATLSCEMCRHRKIKCDKQNPCGTCVKAGVKCIPVNRQRLPRGRNGGRRKADAELKARVNRLESLVKTLEASTGGDDDVMANLASFDPTRVSSSISQRLPMDEAGIRDDSKGNHGAGVSEDARSRSKSLSPNSESLRNNIAKYAASPFWSSLSSQINGLREILEDESDEEDFDDIASNTTRRDSAFDSVQIGCNFILSSSGPFVADPTVLQHPPQQAVAKLATLFRYHVDPCCHILHAPTMRAHMLERKPYLNHRDDDPALNALKFAIYYTSASRLDETEALPLFGQDKQTLISRFKFATEVYLAQADLVNCSSLLPIQAFIFYLATTRSHDPSRRTWSLIGLLVRIAQGMNMHLDDSHHLNSNLSVFEREMRRRVWNQIHVLDGQSSMDRGTNPCFTEADYSTLTPRNLNDEEFGPESSELPEDKDGFTDTTFAIISSTGSDLMKKLNYFPPGEADREPQELESNWAKRRDLVLSKRRMLDSRFLRYMNADNNWHWLMRHIVNAITANLLLVSVRPLQQHPRSNPPRISSTNILQAGVQVLEQAKVLWMDPRIEPWKWWGKLYNQWHSVAVVAAELSVMNSGPLVDHAWEVLEPAYFHFSQTVADSSKGKLWKPIEKLVKKARQHRAKITGQVGGGTMGYCMTTSMSQTASPQQQNNQMPSGMMGSMSLGENSMLPTTTTPGFNSMNPMSQANPNQNFDFNSWDMPMEWDSGGSQDGSPGIAWANWQDFIDDMQDGEVHPIAGSWWGMDLTGTTSGMAMSNSTTAM